MVKKCIICDSENCAPILRSCAQMHPEAVEFGFSQCGNCDYVFIDPPVQSHDLKRFYTEFYLPYRGASAWGKYASLVEKSDRKLNRKRAETALSHLRSTDRTIVLDIGCGKPEFLNECVKNFGCSGIGLDFSDEGWRGSDQYGSLRLIAGEISLLPTDFRADVVTMWHYLEHDYAPHETLKSLSIRSDSQTRLIIEVPDFDSESRRRFGANWAGFHTPRHFSVFSEKNLRLLLEKNGWEVIRIDRFGTLDPYVLHWMSKMEEKGIGWNQTLESEFWGFVRGMLAFRAANLVRKKRPLGLMTAFAKPQR